MFSHIVIIKLLDSIKAFFRIIIITAYFISPLSFITYTAPVATVSAASSFLASVSSGKLYIVDNILLNHMLYNKKTIH